jgi:hypothetical protein
MDQASGEVWRRSVLQLRQLGNPKHARLEQSVGTCHGRAVDLSYSKSEKHPTANRKGTMAFINIVTANANALGLECILDYLLKPYGRGWRCDRQRWRKYSKPTIHGAPGGRWLHIEISPAMADSPALVRQAFQRVFAEIPQ